QSANRGQSKGGATGVRSTSQSLSCCQITSSERSSRVESTTADSGSCVNCQILLAEGPNAEEDCPYCFRPGNKKGGGWDGCPPDPPCACAQLALRVPARVGTISFRRRRRRGSCRSRRRLHVARWSIHRDAIRDPSVFDVKTLLSSLVMTPVTPRPRV